MTYEEFSSEYQCLLRESLRRMDDHNTENYIIIGKKLRFMEKTHPEEWVDRVETDMNNYANGID